MNDFEGLRKIARWGLYPFSWAVLLVLAEFMRRGAIEPGNAWGTMVALLALTYLIMERLVPYEARWSMTWKSFFNDLKYLLINSSTLALTSAVLGLYAIRLAGNPEGYASSWPFLAQLGMILVLFEVVNYTIHRVMHEAKGVMGRFLWKTHAAHHLPDRVYLVMHVAGHPINAIITQCCALILPIWLMGYDQSAVTVFLMINSMHGLISHFNVDVRMGWLNYLFVGPELHRYHHSADIDEAKNYGATLSILDQLFGTFVYRPGVAPQELGVSEDQNFPDYGDTLAVLKLPFTRK